MMPASKTMRIVAVGDELIAGRTVDTNSTWLARTAFAAGWRCLGMQQVGDDPQAMQAALMLRAGGIAGDCDRRFGTDGRRSDAVWVNS